MKAGIGRCRPTLKIGCGFYWGCDGRGRLMINKNASPVNKARKPQPVVTLNITSGPATPAQLAAWRKFWTKLIGDCHEPKSENESNHNNQ